VIVCPLLCGGKFGKDSHFHIFGLGGCQSRNDNWIKVIMEALLIGGGLPWNEIAQKFIYFGVDGVNVFWSTRISCHECQCYGVHSFECSSMTCNKLIPNF